MKDLSIIEIPIKVFKLFNLPREVFIMKDYIWFIYAILIIFVMFLFLRVDLYFKFKKYRKFLYINIGLLLWTLMIGLRFVVSNNIFTYYASLSIYPIVFGLVILLVLAIRDYLVIKNGIWLKTSLLIMWVINAVTVLTNTTHQLIIKLSYDQNVTLRMFNDADVGFGFFIHTIISYILLAYVFFKLSRYFLNQFRNSRDFVPLLLISLCFISGLAVNLIHLFVYEFNIDPTLIIFVMFMGSLSIISIIRDLNLISQLNNNQFILDHYREMYLIVDINGMVVNASDELKTKFDLGDLSNISFDEITQMMHQKAIIYSDSIKVDQTFQKDKIYLHMKEERINLPLFKYSGKLFLYYDETEHQHLLNKLNDVYYHDLMTDLYNRNFFEDYKEILNNSKEPYGVIIFDLDGLKRTNDSHGHEAGDQLLICFANSLKEVAKTLQKATAIRLGGDEFLLIVENQIMFDKNKIIEDINTFIKEQNNNHCMGYSYGAHLNADEQTIAKVLRLADDALYEMKKQRKDRS